MLVIAVFTYLTTYIPYTITPKTTHEAMATISFKSYASEVNGYNRFTPEQYILIADSSDREFKINDSDAFRLHKVGDSIRIEYAERVKCIPHLFCFEHSVGPVSINSIPLNGKGSMSSIKPN